MTNPEQGSTRLSARQAGAALKWRAFGTIASRLIGVGRSIVLARLLAPDDFGLFAIALVAADLVTGATELGLAGALVQREHPEQRHYDVAWTLGVGRGVLIALVAGLAAVPLASAIGDQRAAAALAVLAFRPLVSAMASVRTVDLDRTLRFGAIAVVDVSGAVAGAGLAIALARPLGVWALVWGTLGGAAVSTVVSYVVAPYRPRLTFDLGAARGLISFGWWILIGTVVSMIGEAILRAVIARQLGTAALGVYYLAASVASLPEGVLGGLVTAVAFPIHARAQEDTPRAQTVFRTSLLGLMAVIVPLYTALIVLARPVVTELLGAQWVGAIPVIRILSVVALLSPVIYSALPLLEGRGRTDFEAGLWSAFTLVIALAAAPLAAAFGLSGAALSRLLADALVAVCAAWLAGRLIQGPFHGLGRPVGAISCSGVVAALVAWLGLIVHGAIALFVIGALALLASALTLAVLDRRLGLGLRSDLSKLFPEFGLRVE